VSRYADATSGSSSQSAADAAGDRLGVLSDFSLLAADEGGRYRMHDLVRIFASRQLDDETRQIVARRHAEHFWRLLAAAESEFLTGGETMAAGLSLLDREWENVMAGQKWAGSQADTDDAAARLTLAYIVDGAHVLNLLEHPRDSITRSEIGLAAARRLGDRGGEAKMMGTLGNAFVALGEPHRAIQKYDEALTIARAINNRQVEGSALGSLGIVHLKLGNPLKAIEYHKQHWAVAEEVGDFRALASVLGGIGNAMMALGDTRPAIQMFRHALTIMRELRDRYGEGKVRGALGAAYFRDEDDRQAVIYLQEALVIARDLGDRVGEGTALFNLALSHAVLGQVPTAIEFAEAAIPILERLEDPDAASLRANVVAWRQQVH
jgi:tetratricopeptide (TPR) repeat protein